MKRKGFTLVELLVVIAVIGILAALLLPALSSVQEKGKQIKCKANMSQMGKSLKIYLQDFGKDRKYPDTNGVGYVCRIYSFNILNELELFICPSTSDEEPLDDDLRALTDENLDDTTDPSCSYAGRRNKTQKAYPGIYRAFKDTTLTTMGADDWKGASDQGNHEDGQVVNFLFVDAHVQHTRISDNADHTELNWADESAAWNDFSSREKNFAHVITN